MICPKCKADTRVVDSRPAQNGEVIRRRRVCDDCGHRFPTYETTFNAAAHRRQNAEYAKARRKADPEWAKRQDAKRAKRRSLQKQAIAEAAETGRPLAEIAQAWGIAVPAAYSASPNP